MRINKYWIKDIYVYILVKELIELYKPFNQYWTKVGFYLQNYRLHLGPSCHTLLSLLLSSFLPLPLSFPVSAKWEERTREWERERAPPRQPFRPKFEKLNEELESRTLIHSIGKSLLSSLLISSFRISRVSVKTRRIAPNWLFRVFVVSKVFICRFRVPICNQISDSWISPKSIWVLVPFSRIDLNPTRIVPWGALVP